MTPRRVVDVLEREWIVTPSTIRLCVHCRKRPVMGQSAFCKQSCRTMNHRIKWQAAPIAVMGRLQEWTDVHPTPARVDSLFEWFVDEAEDGITLRARLMLTLGLHWMASERRWVTR